MGKGAYSRIPLLPRAVSSTSIDEPERDLTGFQLSLLSQFFLLLWCGIWVIFVFIEPGSEDALNLFGEPAPTATLFGGIGIGIGIGSTWCRCGDISTVVASRPIRKRWRVIDAILN